MTRPQGRISPGTRRGKESRGTSSGGSARMLAQELFRRVDESPDALFYEVPRLVTHIDDPAIAAVTQLYREYFPAGGAILDLMSSWVSHLPGGDRLSPGRRPRDERRGARRQSPPARAHRPGPEPGPAPAVRRRGVRRGRHLRVGGLPDPPRRGAARVRPRHSPRRPARDHVLQPVLPHQGDRRVADARRRGPSAARRAVLRDGGQLDRDDPARPEPGDGPRPALRRGGPKRRRRSWARRTTKGPRP